MFIYNILQYIIYYIYACMCCKKTTNGDSMQII